MEDSAIDRLARALRDQEEEGEELAEMLCRFFEDPVSRYTLHALGRQGINQSEQERDKPEVSREERILLEYVLEAKRPLSAQEIAQEIPAREYSKTLGHRSAVSDRLNSLVEKGYLGKAVDPWNSRVVLFDSRQHAVLESLKDLSQLPVNCNPAEISRRTGLSIAAVAAEIVELATI